MDANPSIATRHLQRPTATGLPDLSAPQVEAQNPMLHSMKGIYFTVAHKFQLLTQV